MYELTLKILQFDEKTYVRFRFLIRRLAKYELVRIFRTSNKNKMKNYSATTEDTLITFHIGRGGRFYNQGHKSYVNQDMTIDSYTDQLFVNYENQREIAFKIGDRKNLMDLFISATEGDTAAKQRIEKITGIVWGKEIYVELNGNPVGLDVENDGTGIIDEDGEYDTTIVRHLKDCDDDELLLIYQSHNYVSADVREYCREILVTKNIIDMPVETEE